MSHYSYLCCVIRWQKDNVEMKVNGENPGLSVIYTRKKRLSNDFLWWREEKLHVAWAAVIIFKLSLCCHENKAVTGRRGWCWSVSGWHTVRRRFNISFEETVCFKLCTKRIMVQIFPQIFVYLRKKWEFFNKQHRLSCKLTTTYLYVWFSTFSLSF